MNKIITYSYKSNFGELIIGSIDDCICLCDWKYRRMRSSIDKRIQDFFKANYQEGRTTAIDNCILQLQEYAAKQRQVFEIGLKLGGSKFQQEVWNELIQIPYGKTLSYIDLAQKLENPGAVRAVASANGANAISILIPCHRIIGADGALRGYAGGLRTKKNLLKLEGAIPNVEQGTLFA